MSSHHNTNRNYPDEHHKDKYALSNVDREIKMGELRLRYVQLMRDVHSSLGYEDARILIKESEKMWDRLNNAVSVEK